MRFELLQPDLAGRQHRHQVEHATRGGVVDLDRLGGVVLADQPGAPDGGKDARPVGVILIQGPHAFRGRVYVLGRDGVDAHIDNLAPRGEL